MPQKRITTSIRPKHGDGPAYCPQRDLAYIYLPAMREAVSGLDQVNWSAEMRAWLEQQGITEDELGQAVGSLVKAHSHFVNDERVAEPVDALQFAGWYDFPIGVRQVIMARFGEVILGGFFVALRDVTVQADIPPNMEDMVRLVGHGAMIANRTGVATESTDEITDEERVMQAEAAKEMVTAAFNRLRTQYREVTMAHHDQTKELRQVRAELYQLRDDLAQAVQDREDDERALAAFDTMNFFRRLWWAFASKGARRAWVMQQTFQTQS